jgi:hypothetical protein
MTTLIIATGKVLDLSIPGRKDLAIHKVIF